MDEQEELLKNLDKLEDLSRFYFYDDNYDKHIKKINKLRKHIQSNSVNKYLNNDEKDVHHNV